MRSKPLLDSGLMNAQWYTRVAKSSAHLGSAVTLLQIVTKSSLLEQSACYIRCTPPVQRQKLYP